MKCPPKSYVQLLGGTSFSCRQTDTLLFHAEHLFLVFPHQRHRLLSFSVLMPLLFDSAKTARMLHGIYPNGNILSVFGRIKTKTDLKKIPFAIILRKCCLILSGCKICFNNISPGNEKCSKKFLIITVRCRFF